MKGTEAKVVGFLTATALLFFAVGIAMRIEGNGLADAIAGLAGAGAGVTSNAFLIFGGSGILVIAIYIKWLRW